MTDAISFQLEAVSGKARAATLRTPHGELRTPFFMPVGTVAAVKGLTPAMLREAGSQIVLANTYHLAVRPGEKLVDAFGGVAKFMGWHGPTLTDSGGFQAFSLAKIRKMDDAGVRFQNHFDGAELFLTPESAVEIQQLLGADMFMILDECPPANSSREKVAEAVGRTTRWAKRCFDAWSNREKQALFGIVQGGLFEDLRAESAEQIGEIGFPGNAIGGVSVGEDPAEMDRIVAHTAPLLPETKPRYLMGVGRPQDMLRAISHGVDMFDCVMPTRHARHAQAFTSSGTINLKNNCHREDESPLDPQCDCYACRTVSRGYLRHLFNVKEMLGPIYLSIHNIRFYHHLMEQARAAIIANRYDAFLREKLSGLES
jgi:queuine tRNA-ribosyltransferase